MGFWIDLGVFLDALASAGVASVVAADRSTSGPAPDRVSAPVWAVQSENTPAVVASVPANAPERNSALGIRWTAWRTRHQGQVGNSP